MSKKPANTKGQAKSQTAIDEERILDHWQKQNIFIKTLSKDSPKGDFVFYDGPPYATGLPHYGHLLAGTIKDVIPRYKTMQGYHVPRQWGWDCHGLPIENLIQKELNLPTRQDIVEYGIDKFNQAARENVLRYEQEWLKYVPRMGRFVDMSNPYKTMDSSYIESVWAVFKNLYTKNLVYKGHKSMMVSPPLETVLSNQEVSMGGYKDIVDMSVTAKFTLSSGQYAGAHMIAWTTTPWTLPGNTLLAVGADINYSLVSCNQEQYIAATELLEEVFDGKSYEIISSMTGKALTGESYVPVFPYFSDWDNAFVVTAAEFVTTQNGTGIVHIAPAFGEDDLNLGQTMNVKPIQHVLMNGHFTQDIEQALVDEGYDVAGWAVRNTVNHMHVDIEIVKYLAHHDKLFSKEKYKHSYPVCWRTDCPLINYATDSWFISVTSLKDNLIKNNNKTTWVPDHVKSGRFGKWLENVRDWAVSRSRFWGTPIPIWTAEDGEILVIGSYEELAKYAVNLPSNAQDSFDFHRPYIDEIVLEKDGKKFTRISEVFDVWFDSGSMPYASHHYPFNQKLFDPNKKNGTKRFPADFVAEGQDQTRGWFYVMMVLSTAQFDEPAFKNVLVNGMVLAEDGKKMSKRLKNYPDLNYILDKYGADAIRLFLMASPAVHAEDLNFDEKAVAEVRSKVMGRLRNTVSFYKLYATNSDLDPHKSPNILDKWIITRLAETAKQMSDALDVFYIDRAARPIFEFVDDLSTWYLRRSRDRFKSDASEDQQYACAVTRFILISFSKLIAPFTPFVAEEIYKDLDGNLESVHLESWPVFNDIKINNDILESMQQVRSTVSQALELRAKEKIKVRQPLSSISVVQKFDTAYANLICEELNVKKVIQGSVFALDTVLNEDLIVEGVARELIRIIQTMRKEAGLQVSQHIEIELHTPSKIGSKAINDFVDDIKNTAGITVVHINANNGKAVIVNDVEFTIMLLPARSES